MLSENVSNLPCKINFQLGYLVSPFLISINSLIISINYDVNIEV